MEYQKRVREAELLTELKSCCLRRDLHWGRRIHRACIKDGIDSNLHLRTALIKMYAKCGSMLEARRTLSTIQKPNVACWNALLLGYAANGQGESALELFSRMKATKECAPDSATYVAVLKACASLLVNEDGVTNAQCLAVGRRIHAEVGRHLDLYVQNALIDMYAKGRSIGDARKVFDGLREPSLVSWTALILGYADNGQGHIALELFSKMKIRGCAPNHVTYVAVLKAVTSLAVNQNASVKIQCLRTGRSVHAEIGCHISDQVLNTLIHMYAKCGSMADARLVFDSILKPSLVAWNALLFGYVDNGEGLVALDLFSRMCAAGVCMPDSVTYVAAIKACTSLAMSDGLETGRNIHSTIGCHLNLYVQNTLIDMYAKCGSIRDARRVFDSMPKRSLASWNALLHGYVENGGEHVALDLFSRMKAARVCTPDSVTFAAVLKACSSLALNGEKALALKCGRNIHLETGCHLDLYVQSTLIDMYAKCGSMSDARLVFDTIQNPNVVSWTALLMGYAEKGDGHTVLKLFWKMKSGGCAPSSITYVAVLKACGLLGDLELGRKVHSEIGEYTAHVVTCLVDFYAKCGSLNEARAVFDLHSRTRNISTWNALLAGYSTHGDASSVLKLVRAMQDERLRPDALSFSCILSCCDAENAKEYLKAIPVSGVKPSVIHYNCVVDALGRANQLNEAIAALRRMPCEPDVVIWMTLLGACGKWKNVRIGTLAFESLMDMDEKNSAAYVLMAHVQRSPGMWEAY